MPYVLAELIRHLVATRGVDLDRGLSPRERAIALAFRRMLKENDYWGLIHSRYFVDANWAEYRKLLGMVFAPEGPVEAGLEAAEGFKQTMVAAMHGQGIGRHAPEELVALVQADLQAVSDLLGEREWMMGGEGPTTLDATVYGYVANFLEHPYDDPISAHARSLSNVVALCRRVRDRYFPELAALPPLRTAPMSP